VEAILALSHQGADVVDREGLEHEVADFVAFEAEMIIRDGNVSKGLDRAVQILNRHHLRLAPRFSLLLKGLATIEVVGRKLYPDLDFIPILEPYVRNLIAERYQPSHLMRDAQQNAATLLKLSRQLPIDLSMSLQQLRKGQLSVRLKHDQIHTLANTMDRTSNRNALATVIASMIIGSSLIVTAETALRPLGYFGFVAAAMLGVWLVISIITSRKY